MADGKIKARITAENENEVRALFPDDIEFERFKAGEDYTNLLSTITDAEYKAHYGRLVSAIHKLVDSGKVQKGTSVFLETVTIPFLKFAPLIEGEWVDRYVLMLAEVGAIAIDKGYKMQETNDQHPLSWPKFLDSSDNEVDPQEIINLRSHANRHLKKFPGRAKEIGGRPYL